MLLFFVFRKAFDLIDTPILLRKLHLYGFDNFSLNLIANYFCDWFQIVKYENQLCCPQIFLKEDSSRKYPGLFFLIFINDLGFILDLNCKMFADDTILYESDSNTNTLISKHKNKLEPLFDWCKYNKLDIN